MKRIITIVMILVSTSAFSQLTNLSEIWKDSEFKGDELYAKGLYESAIVYYQKEIDENINNTKVSLSLANTYKKMGKYAKSKQYFDVVANTNRLKGVRNFENYAEVLLSNDEFEKALQYFRMVLEAEPENNIVRNRIIGILSRSEYFLDEEYIEIKPVAFNTEFSEYAMRPFDDGFCFTSSQSSDKMIQHNYLRDAANLSNIYVVKLNKGKFSKSRLLEINDFRRKNDGPITSNSSVYVISRNNDAKSENRKNLGLYLYTKDSEKGLVFKEDYPYNSPNYSITHPAFNELGDTLYFSSDMTGGFGGFDIYYSIYKNDNWSPPLNLGDEINTSRNEIYPYSSKGTLYFSSDGHPGLGGIDTYRWIQAGDSTIVQNMGFPINSGFDDFAIYIENEHGFISSNVPSSKGNDDIYEFRLLPKPIVISPVEVSLNVLDKTSNSPLENATVILVSEGDSSSYTLKDGHLVKELMPGTYSVIVKEDGYDGYSYAINVEAESPLNEEIKLDPSFVMHIVSPDSIMFGFGEYVLLESAAEAELDSIVSTLTNFEDFNLEISAHTDSRGSKDYNMWLSERRAESAASYLISSGIATERIIRKGFGESELLNNCHDGVKCSDKAHAVNRRIEFSFVRKEQQDLENN